MYFFSFCLWILIGCIKTVLISPLLLLQLIVGAFFVSSQLHQEFIEFFNPFNNQLQTLLIVFISYLFSILFFYLFNFLSLLFFDKWIWPNIKGLNQPHIRDLSQYQALLIYTFVAKEIFTFVFKDFFCVWKATCGLV